MKRFALFLLFSFVTISGYAQDTVKVAVTPFVHSSDILTGELKTIMEQKTEQMALQNGMDVGDSSRFVLASRVDVKSRTMTSTIPQKCVVELGLSLYVKDVVRDSVITRMSSKLTGIESSEGKAIYKAISRMNVRTSQIRKFMVVSRDKIIELENIE